MPEPVLNEKTRLGLSITAAIAILLAVFGFGASYGKWDTERTAITARDDRQDMRLKTLEDWKDEARVWQVNTSNDIRGVNEKLEALLKENKALNSVLLYTAGGDRKKIPADN
jgi:hypothetical protein